MKIRGPCQGPEKQSTPDRSLEDSGTRSRTGGSKFDFVTGRYSNDNRHTNLRDADEPSESCFELESVISAQWAENEATFLLEFGAWEGVDLRVKDGKNCR